MKPIEFCDKVSESFKVKHENTKVRPTLKKVMEIEFMRGSQYWIHKF